MPWHKTEDTPPNSDRAVLVNFGDHYAVMTYEPPDQHGYCWQCTNGGSGWTIDGTYWTELPQRRA